MGLYVPDGLADPFALVGGQVIHDNDVAGAESRGQAFFDIGFEYVAVHRAIALPFYVAVDGDELAADMAGLLGGQDTSR